MTLNDIEAFLAIVEYRNLTTAANALYISQPTVSHRLKALEQELGSALIARRKGQRNVDLTAFGEAFIPMARQWRSLWRATMLMHTGTEELPLSIGCPDSLNVHVFPSLYQKLASLGNPIRLHIHTQQSPEIYTLLDEGVIDIGFVFQQLRYRDIICKPIFDEPMYMVCRPDAPYQEPVHPNELLVQDELFLAWSPDIQRWHDTWWSPSESPHVTVDTAALLLGFMNTPRHWAMCPRSVAASFLRSTRIAIHTFSEPPPNRVCYLVESRNPALSRVETITLFKTQLQEYIAQNDFSESTRALVNANVP